MQKLGYDLYWTDGERAQNKDNNNLYLKGEVSNGVIQSIDSIADYEGNVLIEKPEIIGTVHGLDLSSITVDELTNSKDSFGYQVEWYYDDGKTHHSDYTVENLPLNVLCSIADETNYSGVVAGFGVGEDDNSIDFNRGFTLIRENGKFNIGYNKDYESLVISNESVFWYPNVDDTSNPMYSKIVEYLSEYSSSHQDDEFIIVSIEQINACSFYVEKKDFNVIK